MSEFHINIIRVGKIEAHPNADALELTRVFDYPVIVRKGEYKEGDLAVYIPVDSVVPDTEQWAFLAGHRRIKAKRLRGIFSMGLLSQCPISNKELLVGEDVRDIMNITKYEPPPDFIMGGESELGPLEWSFPTYTDLEALRRHPNVLVEGESVVLTEKIHGANARFVHDGNRLWVGSHTQIKRQEEESKKERGIWWRIANKTNLEYKLSKVPMYVFFGEVYGGVQDLKYGLGSDCDLRIFDVYDIKKMKYLDFNDAWWMTKSCGLQWVPVLYEGQWRTTLSDEHAEGLTQIPNGKNVREGFVVRPIVERYDSTIGRVILKRHGEGYLLRNKEK